jgi:hypothetical protein
MRILKQFTRKKNAFREIKFNLINYRYRNKAQRQPFNSAKIQHVLLLRLDDKVGDMVVTTGCAKLLADRGYKVSVLTGPVCKQMLAGSDFLEQVYLYQPRMPLNALRAAGFDAVVDFDDVKTYERFKLLADLRPAALSVLINKNISFTITPSLFWIAAAIFPRAIKPSPGYLA